MTCDCPTDRAFYFVLWIGWHLDPVWSADNPAVPLFLGARGSARDCTAAGCPACGVSPCSLPSRCRSVIGDRDCIGCQPAIVDAGAMYRTVREHPQPILRRTPHPYPFWKVTGHLIVYHAPHNKRNQTFGAYYRTYKNVIAQFASGVDSLEGSISSRRTRTLVQSV